MEMYTDEFHIQDYYGTQMKEMLRVPVLCESRVSQPQLVVHRCKSSGHVENAAAYLSLQIWCLSKLHETIGRVLLRTIQCQYTDEA